LDLEGVAAEERAKFANAAFGNDSILVDEYLNHVRLVGAPLIPEINIYDGYLF
jgi:hypothetical protein